MNLLSTGKRSIEDLKPKSLIVEVTGTGVNDFFIDGKQVSEEEFEKVQALHGSNGWDVLEPEDPDR